jgi:hypothetical protein
MLGVSLVVRWRYKPTSPRWAGLSLQAWRLWRHGFTLYPSRKTSHVFKWDFFIEFFLWKNHSYNQVLQKKFIFNFPIFQVAITGHVSQIHEFSPSCASLLTGNTGGTSDHYKNLLYCC